MSWSYCFSCLNLATLWASPQYPLRFKAYISAIISVTLLSLKNYLLYFSVFSLNFYSYSSSHSSSSSPSDQTERQKAILSTSSCLQSLAICQNLGGIFKLSSLKALQTYLSILTSLSLKSVSSYSSLLSFLLYYCQYLRLLHFLFTWSIFTGTSSSKIRLAAHRSYYRFFRLLRTFCKQGYTSLPNNLANSIRTFQDRSESLLAINLNLLYPLLTILWIFSILLRKSLSSIFQPSLIPLNPSFPLLFMQLTKYQEQTCFLKLVMVKIGQMLSLPYRIKFKSICKVLDIDRAFWKGTIYWECFSYMQSG